MKKLLALALTLALCLGLCAPALALTPPMADDYTDVDPYEEYELAHPEEIAALDVDALIAAWGYEDKTAREAFLEDNAWAGDTVEEAVKGYYIDRRLMVQEDVEAAPLYQAQYPDAWAGFDADAFFQSEYGDYWEKGEYMAEYCLFSQEEFVNDMFTDYIEYGYADENDYDWDWDDDYSWDQPEEEPTLKLMVNGVASDVAIAAENGVSYADAAALRAILGDKAVPVDVTGNTAIRPAAELAGWDVAWYNGGWRGVDQEIQLWDKAAFEAELADQFGPCNDFLVKALEVDREVMNTKTPISGHETMNVDVTRFSTLDGDKSCELKATVDYVVQAGVMDVTVTFDMSQWLDLLPGFNRAMIEADEDAPSWEQITQALREGKMEFIIDCNRGMTAWNVPFMALDDPDLAGWNVEYTDIFAGMMGGDPASERETFVSTLYAQMTRTASASYGGGAAEALAEYRADVATWATFVGKDRFTTQNGKTTYALTTQGVNLGLAKAMELAKPEEASLFKAFEVSYARDTQGKTDLKVHIRPDVDGMLAAEMERMSRGDSTTLSLISFGLLGGRLDMDITAELSGGPARASGQLAIHWNNMGRLDMKAEASAGSAAKAPRQIDDLELKTEIWGPFGPDFGGVEDELDPGFSVGLIGGADGPTAIWTTH